MDLRTFQSQVRDCEDCLNKLESGETLNEEQQLKAMLGIGVKTAVEAMSPYADSIRLVAKLVKSGREHNGK